MHKKRGQITIFIIIGIVILFLMILTFFLVKVFSEHDYSHDYSTDNFKPVSRFVENCIRSASAQAGYYVSLHGGWHHVPADSIQFYDRHVSIVYEHPGLFKLPTLSDMEDNYALKAQEKLQECTGSFSMLENMGYRITEGNPTADANILNDTTVVEVEYPINVSKGGSRKVLRDFEKIRLEIRTGRLYKIAKKMVNRGNPNIPASVMNDLSAQGINAYAQKKNDYWIFMLIDNTTPDSLNNKYNSGQDHVFMFGEYYG